MATNTAKARHNISPPPLQPSTNESFDFLNLSWQSYPYLQAPYTFASDVIGNEFSVLNDFMTLGDDLHEPSFDTSLADPMSGLMPGTATTNFQTDQSFNQINSNGNNNNNSNLLPPPPQDGSMIFDRPHVAPSPNPNGNNREAEVARENYLLTAADPAGEVSPEERLKQVINAKVDAGILKPFNYVKGYARLQKYMEIQYYPTFSLLLKKRNILLIKKYVSYGSSTNSSNIRCIQTYVSSNLTKFKRCRSGPRRRIL